MAKLTKAQMQAEIDRLTEENEELADSGPSLADQLAEAQSENERLTNGAGASAGGLVAAGTTRKKAPAKRKKATRKKAPKKPVQWANPLGQLRMFRREESDSWDEEHAYLEFLDSDGEKLVGSINEETDLVAHELLEEFRAIKANHELNGGGKLRFDGKMGCWKGAVRLYPASVMKIVKYKSR